MVASVHPSNVLVRPPPPITGSLASGEQSDLTAEQGAFKV